MTMGTFGETVVRYLPDMLQYAGWALALWGWWSLKRVFVSYEALDRYKTQMGDRLAEIERQQMATAAARKRLEGRLDQLPTAREMQAIFLALKELEGDVKSMDSKIEGLDHATSRLERSLDLLTESHLGKR